METAREPSSNRQVTAAMVGAHRAAMLRRGALAALVMALSATVGFPRFRGHQDESAPAGATGWPSACSRTWWTRRERMLVSRAARLKQLQLALQPVLTKLGMTSAEPYKALSSGQLAQVELLKLLAK